MNSTTKSNILVVGFGGVGTISAFNLEAGGLATVTGVLRSNYDIVKNDGFKIWSIDHGDIPSWRPSNSRIESETQYGECRFMIND